MKATLFALFATAVLAFAAAKVTTIKPDVEEQSLPANTKQPTICKLTIDPGTKCGSNKPSERHGFEINIGQCIKFTYRGCGGNQNNFLDYSECTHTCEVGKKA